MKRIILLFSAVLFLLKTQAQDIIVKISGDEMKVKVTEITLNDIVYKHPDSLSGQPRTIAKKEVFMVKFANGAKEVITNMEAEITSKVVDYKGSNAFWGSAAASLLPPYGYVVPLGMMLTKPKIVNSNVPNAALLNNINYVQGFEKQAHNRKIGKAAAGMGIGTVVFSAVAIVVLAATLGR